MAGGTQSALLRRERGKGCVAGSSEGKPWAVGEVILRMRESRRNSNYAWTQTHGALSYLVHESMDHVVVEQKRWDLEACEGYGMIVQERMLGSRPGIASLLSPPTVVGEPPLYSCHAIPDRATSAPSL
jgi:hypothetical protein